MIYKYSKEETIKWAYMGIQENVLTFGVWTVQKACFCRGVGHSWLFFELDTPPLNAYG